MVKEYIEREAVIVAMNSEGYTKNMRVHKKVLSIPSADVRPVVHGHWIDKHGELVEVDENGCPKRLCWCSECGDWLTASDEYSIRGCYCPNCGAEMRGEADG